MLNWALENQRNPSQVVSVSGERRITRESFPSYVSSGPTPSVNSRSPIELFPLVKASVLLDIVRHEFKPQDLFKLDSTYQDTTEGFILDLSENTLPVREAASQAYTTFKSLFVPLTVYFQVLQAFMASSGNAADAYQLAHHAMSYMAQLHLLSEQYLWSTVLAYHMDFHRSRLQEMAQGDYSRWGSTDYSLAIKHLVVKVRHRATRKAEKKATTASRSSDVC